MKIKMYSLLVVGVLLLSSCSVRLVDFTVISSKNHSIKFNIEQGIATKGNSMAVFSFGVNIKDAMDEALEKAGPQYDILVNGVVRAKTYFFYGGYEVEGTAVNSRKLIAKLGQKGFNEWLKGQEIFDAKTADVKTEE